MKIIVKIPQLRTRAHRVLFDKELPFHPRREQSRKQYQRHPKNRNQELV
jgi:hypothetical protein